MTKMQNVIHECLLGKQQDAPSTFSEYAMSWLWVNLTAFVKLIFFYTCDMLLYTCLLTKHCLNTTHFGHTNAHAFNKRKFINTGSTLPNEKKLKRK